MSLGGSRRQAGGRNTSQSEQLGIFSPSLPRSLEVQGAGNALFNKQGKVSRHFHHFCEPLYQVTHTQVNHRSVCCSCWVRSTGEAGFVTSVCSGVGRAVLLRPSPDPWGLVQLRGSGVRAELSFRTPCWCPIDSRVESPPHVVTRSEVFSVSSRGDPSAGQKDTGAEGRGTEKVHSSKDCVKYEH